MSYWEDRQAQAQQKLTERGVQETEKQLVRYYYKTMQSVIAQFEATYDHLLNTIAEGRSPVAADLYKLGKYWQMQAQLQNELQKLGDKTAVLLGQQFTNQYINIYESIALTDGAVFNQISRETAEQMINAIWCADGKNWSSRIWTNTENLIQELNDSLIDCVVTGKKTTQLKQILQDRFNVSYSRADALVRTEMAHIQTQAAKQRYADRGVQEVEVWADKDERRCDKCGKLHKKRYPIDAVMPIPAHPRCRCCILPVIDKKINKTQENKQ